MKKKRKSRAAVKPCEAFGELERAAWEIGYRAAKAEMASQGGLAARGKSGRKPVIRPCPRCGGEHNAVDMRKCRG